MSDNTGAFQAEMPPLAALHLAIFSRAPVPGETKTRLIPALGAKGACDFHSACLNRLIAEARAWRDGWKHLDLPAPGLHLFITPPGSQVKFRMAGVDWPGDFSVHNQQGENLGSRMANAMEKVRETVRGQQPGIPPEQVGVMVVGSDLPLMGARHWEAALGQLQRAPMVLGPTPDGGYYLIGMRKAIPEVFRIDGWGGETVLERTLAVAQGLGISVGQIDSLPDVDSGEDISRVLAHPLAGELQASAPMALLRRLSSESR